MSGWLYRIAHNAIIDYYRMRDRHATVCLDEIPQVPGNHDPAADYESAELKAKLLCAMQRLTPGQEQVLRMRYFEGCSFHEIAQEMGSSEGAVKAMQHRAIVSLRELMSYE
jgi:RNA polymerase sigma-70 factor (ECF subfamily)